MKIELKENHIYVNGTVIAMPIASHQVKSMMRYVLDEVGRQVRDSAVEFNAAKFAADTVRYKRLHDPLSESMDRFFYYLKERLGLTVTKSTIHRYEGAVKTIRQYEQHAGTMYVRDVCPAMLDNFKNFVMKVKGNGHNTGVTHVESLRQSMIHETDNRRIPRNPMDDYRQTKMRAPKPFLTKKQLDKVQTVFLKDKHHRLAQQLFIVQSYTGLAYCDLRQLSEKHFEELPGGGRQIVINRKKNGKRCVIFVLPQTEKALETIATLSLSPMMQPREGMLPVPCCMRYNKVLKLVGKQAGIDISLTSHVGRRTFASSVAYTHGASVRTVARALGHTQLIETYRYASVTNEKIKKEMEGKV